MEVDVKNKELLSKLEELIKLPVFLEFNPEDKVFFGYCKIAGELSNTFRVNVKKDSCELGHELLNDNIRNQFIRWFNSYGGNEMLWKEAQTLMNDSTQLPKSS